MLTRLIALTCPTCTHRFSSEALELAPADQRRHTDFHLESERVGTLAYGVHLCPRCGFAGVQEWFADDGIASETVRRHVLEELTPKLTETPVSTSEKYEAAVKVATWDGVPARQVADLWLRAAWACVEEGDIEAERYYRLRAAQSFEQALGDDSVEPDDRAAVTYLIAELWRRIGHRRRAKVWFARVAAEVTDDVSQAWILRWAQRQQDDPQEWFA